MINRRSEFNMRQFKTYAAFAAFGVIGALAMSMPATAAGFCGEKVDSGETTGKTEEDAKKAATVWWSSRAGALGRGYEFWEQAKDKTIKCHKEPPDKFKCVASAKPCLPDGQTPENIRKQDL